MANNGGIVAEVLCWWLPKKVPSSNGFQRVGSFRPKVKSGWNALICSIRLLYPITCQHFWEAGNTRNRFFWDIFGTLPPAVAMRYKWTL